MARPLANAARRHRLCLATLRATKYVFVSGVIARLFLIGFKFAVPFLIKSTTAFSEDRSQPEANGWGLTGAWLLVMVGRAVSVRVSSTMLGRPITFIRSPMLSFTK